MIRVKGFFKNPASGVYVKDPVLLVDFHGAAKGKLLNDVNICEDKSVEADPENGIEKVTNYEQVGAFPFIKDRNELVYSTKVSDPYDQILLAVQDAVMLEIQESEENKNCILTIE